MCNLSLTCAAAQLIMPPSFLLSLRRRLILLFALGVVVVVVVDIIRAIHMAINNNERMNKCMLIDRSQVLSSLSTNYLLLSLFLG